MKRPAVPERLLLALAMLLVLAAPAHAGMLLSEALKQGAQRDPSLAAAYAVRDADAEMGAQERAGLRPTLSVKGQADYSYSDSDFAFGKSRDNFPSWSAYLEARQPLFRYDWFARGDRADVRDTLARIQLRDREIEFVARICQRYLDTLLAQDGLSQAQAEAQAVNSTLVGARQFFEAEVLPGADLKDAQARDDLAQAQLVSAAAALEEARDALQELTGFDRADLPYLRADAVLPPPPDEDMDKWLRLVRENNPRLIAANKEVELTRADLTSRKSEALPQVDLVGRAGRNDSKEYVLGQRQDEAVIGLELNLPLYAGGYNQSRVREAEARVRESELNLQRTTLEIEREVRKAHRDVRTALAEDAAYARALESAIAAEKSAKAGYEAGTRTMTDRLDAQSNVIEARRNRNAARYGALMKLLGFKATIGTLTAEEVYGLDVLFDVSAQSPVPSSP
jgi:TolC family type I secretion outer membrane protein